MNQNQKEIKQGQRKLKWTAVLIIIMILAALALAVYMIVSLPNTSNERYFIRRLDDTLSRQIYPESYLDNKFIFPDEYSQLKNSLSNNFPYITADHLTISVSEADENIIEYACDIPSPAYTALNLTVNGYFEGTHDLLDVVHIEGRAKIEKTLLGRKIIIDEDNTLFYLIFTFMNIQPGLYSNDIDATLQDYYIFVTSQYLKAMDADEKQQLELLERSVSDFDELMTAIEENESEYVEQLSNKSNQYINKNLKLDRASSDYQTHYILMGITAVLLVLIFVLAKRHKKLKEDVDKKKAIEFNRQIHIGKQQLKKDEEQTKDDILLAELKKYSFDQENILYPIMGLVFNPTSNKNIISMLKKIAAENINYQSKKAAKGPYISETILGWSICALARCITLNADSTIEFKESVFNSAIKEYNLLLSRITKLRREYDAYIRIHYPQSRTQPNLRINTQTAEGRTAIDKKEELDELYKDLHGGLIGYCLSQYTDLTFETLIYIMNGYRSQQYSDFMLQNIVIGLFPYMHQHKDTPKISNWYKNLTAMQKQLTDWKNHMYFFEVRLSKQCSEEMFANVLQEILSCASLSFDYADMNKMVEVLTSEIPDVMELLREYPLRLIDTSVKDVKGFMRMKSFEHVLYTSYTPPKDIGPVNKRYNKVIDQTLPNSAGINLQLFCDPYSAVPVMFHEFLHYLGHKNEAAVFLATYHFCDYFYSHYKDAVETLFYDYNYTYLLMKNGLTGKNKHEQIDFINDMIYKKYGEKMSITDAKTSAARMLLMISGQLSQMNAAQKWHKEVPYPLLTMREDPDNARLAYNAEIRLLTADKKIDTQLYDKYQNEWKALIRGKEKDRRNHPTFDDLDLRMSMVMRKQKEPAKKDPKK